MDLREKAKKDKLRRIRAAARQVFQKKGYVSATTREIAYKAEVSVGTLFVYAPAKRDLLLMVYNDDLESLPVLPTDDERPLIEQLVSLYRPRFVLWGRHPELSRYVVREVFEPLGQDHKAAVETLRFRGRRVVVVNQIRMLVVRRQAAGEVDGACNPVLLAHMIHDIFLSENRQWLESPEPDVDIGVESLTRLLQLAISGCLTPA